MRSLPPVDVIVCVHNAISHTLRLLDSLECCAPGEVHLTVVDDQSEPHAASILRDRIRTFRSGRYIRTDERLYYTGAANLGISATSREFLLLLNSDTIVPISLLPSLLSPFEKDQRLGIVSPLSNAAGWQSMPFLSLIHI